MDPMINMDGNYFFLCKVKIWIRFMLNLQGCQALGPCLDFPGTRLYCRLLNKSV